MKREIRFRITYQHEDTGRITQRIIELGQPIPHLGERWFVIGQDQFTGLHDKNGKEIYEGDVVNGVYETDSDFNATKSELRIVEFGNYSFRLSSVSGETKNRLSEYFYLEVIGNIYENPELLKITER